MLKNYVCVYTAGSCVSKERSKEVLRLVRETERLDRYVNGIIEAVASLRRETLSM